MFGLTSRLPASLRLLGVTVVTIPYVPRLRLNASAVNSYPVRTVIAKPSPEVSVLFCTERKICSPTSSVIVDCWGFFLPFFQHVRFRESESWKESDSPPVTRPDGGNSRSASQSYVDISTEDSSVFSWGYDVSRTLSKPRVAQAVERHWKNHCKYISG